MVRIFLNVYPERCRIGLPCTNYPRRNSTVSYGKIV